MTVTALLVENLPEIMDIKFTAHMEEDLDKVSNGKLERDKLLRSFYKSFQKNLQAFVKKVGGRSGKVAQPTDVDCPQCKKGKLAILLREEVSPFSAVIDSVRQVHDVHF